MNNITIIKLEILTWDFLFPASPGHINQMNNQNINTANVSGARNQANQLTPATSDDLRYHGTELVMLYDYKVEFNNYD